jgi:hypothetical protein
MRFDQADMGDPFVASDNIGKLEEHPIDRIHPFEGDINKQSTGRHTAALAPWFLGLRVIKDQLCG